MSLAGKKVLVTGGLGFIGSNLCIRLVREGADVTVYDALHAGCGGNPFNVHPVRKTIRITLADMLDRKALSRAIQRQDYIFNLAGQVGHQFSMDHPLFDLNTNVQAHLHLMEACRRLNPEAVVLYASTRQFYGPPAYLPVDEEHPIRPPDLNGIHKWAGEQYHLLYAKIYGIRTVALRLTNTYGPRQHIADPRQGFVGWFIHQALSGDPIRVYEDGGQLRDYNYVDDVVEAMLLAAQNENCYGEAFNLSGETASVRQTADLITELCPGTAVETVQFPDSHKRIDIGSIYSRSERLRLETGWVPQTSLADGLRQTIDYYKAHREHYFRERRGFA